MILVRESFLFGSQPYGEEVTSVAVRLAGVEAAGNCCESTAAPQCVQNYCFRWIINS